MVKAKSLRGYIFNPFSATLDGASFSEVLVGCCCVPTNVFHLNKFFVASMALVRAIISK